MLNAATAAGAAPVPAPGSGLARDPAAPGPHPTLPACRLLQLRPALPLLHPGQLLSRPAAGGEGGQGQRSCGESAQRRGWRQVRLAKTQRGGLDGGRYEVSQVLEEKKKNTKKPQKTKKKV